MEDPLLLLLCHCPGFYTTGSTAECSRHSGIPSIPRDAVQGGPANSRCQAQDPQTSLTSSLSLLCFSVPRVYYQQSIGKNFFHSARPPRQERCILQLASLQLSTTSATQLKIFGSLATETSLCLSHSGEQDRILMSQKRTILKRFFPLDIFFDYISNVIPFPGFPSKNPLSTAPPAAHQLTPSSCPWHCDIHWGIEPSQDQGLLLPLIQLGHPLLHIQLES